MTDSFVITDVAALRAHYAPPSERAQRKCLSALDPHMRHFIGVAPFVCLGTSGPAGADVTPRGDTPGFVHVVDETTMLVPDWPGNNRLDSFSNIVANPHVALLFMIPGVNETLRVNGTAEISLDPQLLQHWDVDGKHPRAVLRVTVREAYLHCAKALIRSRLWRDDARVPRSALPTYGQMLKDQIPLADSAEQIQASIDKAYREGLY
jgi:PPOX class probable FMN-dependent enzyme